MRAEFQGLIDKQNEVIGQLRVKISSDLSQIKVQKTAQTPKPSSISQPQQFNIEPYLAQISKNMEMVEQRLNTQIHASIFAQACMPRPEFSVEPIAIEGDVREVINQIQGDHQRKFKRLVQIDAQMKHYQTEHEHMKQRRFHFEKNQTN